MLIPSFFFQSILKKMARILSYGLLFSFLTSGSTTQAEKSYQEKHVSSNLVSKPNIIVILTDQERYATH